ncbi:MAG: GGDEF domain-containing protein [Byssovorax sp.]
MAVVPHLLVSELQATGTEPLPAWTLIVIYSKKPSFLGKRIALDRSPLRIGRSADNDVVLAWDSASRHHAHVERREEGYFLVDLGSTNGTWLNDVQLTRKETALKDGDRITIGQTIFKLVSDPDDAPGFIDVVYDPTSLIDCLTQVHNKRHFNTALDSEIARCRREPRELAILLLDIDRFKRVNDAHGHLAGDFVLKELARLLKARTRGEDVLARYSGNEFAMVLPGTTLAAATELADSLRQQIADHVFTYQAESMRITLSASAAVLQESDKGPMDLVNRVDEQLLNAKVLRRRGPRENEP